MMAGMLTMEFVPKLPFKGATLLPSSLLAILVAIVIEYAIVRNVPCGATTVADDAHRRLAEEMPSLLSHMYHDAGRMLADVASAANTTTVNANCERSRADTRRESAPTPHALTRHAAHTPRITHTLSTHAQAAPT